MSCAIYNSICLRQHVPFSADDCSYGNRMIKMMNSLYLICGTFKEDMQENYSYLFNWIKETVTAAKKEDTDVWLLVDNKLPNLRNDLHESYLNLFFLKEQTSLYWTTLMKKAEKIYSIDTGFLHIAHVLNENTFGFGGDVHFWFFKDKTINIEQLK